LLSFTQIRHGGCTENATSGRRSTIAKMSRCSHLEAFAYSPDVAALLGPYQHGIALSQGLQFLTHSIQAQAEQTLHGSPTASSNSRAILTFSGMRSSAFSGACSTVSWSSRLFHGYHKRLPTNKRQISTGLVVYFVRGLRERCPGAVESAGCAFDGWSDEQALCHKCSFLFLQGRAGVYYIIYYYQAFTHESWIKNLALVCRLVLV
jgi:hypothetical protein